MGEWRYSSAILDLALVGTSHICCRSIPMEWDPGTHWIGCWVGPEACLGVMEIIKIFSGNQN
jgi:hypothetical protein